MATADPRLDRLVDWYETLTPASLDRLVEVYHPDARFTDPFNEVEGSRAIVRIFEHMFGALEAPRFEVHARMSSGDQGFLTWDFHCIARGRPLRIHGATHLRFAHDGRVLLHRDYWDAAAELYEKLPLLGVLMRWLRRRLATPA